MPSHLGTTQSQTDQDLVEEIRRRGYRVTTARRAVLSTLLDSADHLTAEEIAAAVKRRNPDVDTSTVYRTLNLFEELGVVEHAHLGHGPAVYHFGRTHQHLVCDSCGAVIEVPISALDNLARDLRRRYGFQLRPGHFALTGRCEQHRHDERDTMPSDSADHDHHASHSHEHTHGDLTHAHSHRQHTHDHLEHAHAHDHGDGPHTHSHAHEVGAEDDHEHQHS